MTAAAAPALAEMEALRGAVAFTALDHVVALRIGGEGAFALLDRLSTAPLYMREGEMRHTLLLTEDGRPFADAYVASDEDGYFVLAEGPDEAALLAHIDRHRPAGCGPAEARVASLGASHALFGLNGPYAWELASALLGPAVMGMTFQSLLRPSGSPPAQGLEDAVCFRAGKTGEYGYDLLVPRAQAAALRAEIARRGEPLGLAPVGLAALDLAALENWHFCIRALGAGAAALTPIELQLQWRVGYDRAFVGAEALRARRAEGPRGRATCFTAAAPVAPGDPVWWEERRVGEVLAAAWSHHRAEHVGSALIELALAHPYPAGRPPAPGELRAETASGPVPLYTRTPPLIDNRSLYVDPHRHSTSTRAADAFPPVVAP